MKIEGADLLSKHCYIKFDKEKFDYYLHLVAPEAIVWVSVTRDLDFKDCFVQGADKVYMKCAGHNFEIIQKKRKPGSLDLG